jgi:hypothetical protein
MVVGSAYHIGGIHHLLTVWKDVEYTAAIHSGVPGRLQSQCGEMERSH